MRHRLLLLYVNMQESVILGLFLMEPYIRRKFYKVSEQILELVFW